MADILLGWARDKAAFQRNNKYIVYLSFNTILKKIRLIRYPETSLPIQYVKNYNTNLTGASIEYWDPQTLYNYTKQELLQGVDIEYFYDPGVTTDVFFYECAEQQVLEYYVDVKFTAVFFNSYPDYNWTARNSIAVDNTTQLTNDVKYSGVCAICQNDLRVTGVNVETLGSNYNVTISATTSDGVLQYSDKWAGTIADTTWTTDNVFTYPIPTTEVETYRIYVSDDAGCQSTFRDVVLEPGNLYSPKFRTEFLDREGRCWRCDIELVGYTGAVTELTASSNPLIISRGNKGGDKTTVIQGSSARMGLISITDFQLVELFSAKDKEWRLQVYRADDSEVLQTYWLGFIATENYQESYARAPYDVSVTFYDGLGRLKNYDYVRNLEVNTTRKVALDVVAECLRETGLSLNIDTYSKIFASSTTEDENVSHIFPLESYSVNTESFVNGGQSKSVYEVLESILKVQKVKLYQEYGRWKIVDRDQSENYHLKTYDSFSTEVVEVYNYKGGYDSILGGQAGSQTNVVNETSLVGGYHYSNEVYTNVGANYNYYSLPIVSSGFEQGKTYRVSCYLRSETSISELVELKIRVAFGVTEDSFTKISVNSLRANEWSQIETVFTVDSTPIGAFLVSQVDAATEGLPFQLRVDGVEIGEYIEPQKTIDATSLVWLANPTKTFEPAYQKLTVEQPLKQRGSVIRNGDFKLETTDGFINWRDDNNILQKTSVESNGKLVPALFISGNGTDTPSFNVASEEFYFDLDQLIVSFKLVIKWRLLGTDTRTVKFAVVAGANYLNDDGTWRPGEEFILESSVVPDQKTQTTEINTDPILTGGSVHVELFQAFGGDGGVVIESVSLTPSVNSIVQEKQTQDFENTESYIHKPEKYQIEFGDTFLFPNAQVLFTNNLYLNINTTTTVKSWRQGITGEARSLSDVLGTAIFNNYSIPTKTITGTLRGTIELSNVLVEQSELYIINSDTYDVKKVEHKVELYQTRGNIVEESNLELLEDKTPLLLEDGQQALLEN